MKLIHSVNAMYGPCGFKVPPNSCVRGLITRLAAICRGEEPLPDVQRLVEPGDCA